MSEGGDLRSVATVHAQPPPRFRSTTRQEAVWAPVQLLKRAEEIEADEQESRRSSTRRGQKFRAFLQKSVKVKGLLNPRKRASLKVD